MDVTGRGPAAQPQGSRDHGSEHLHFVTANSADQVVREDAPTVYL